MNKQELIVEVVERFAGKWPNISECQINTSVIGFDFADFEIYAIYYKGERIEKSEFTQRARELGWINGYKWGVEYPTNGKKPDLPNDTICKCAYIGGEELSYSRQVRFWNCERLKSFRIVDGRYRPKEPKAQSKPSNGFAESAAAIKKLGDALRPDNSWHERGEFPPAGASCEVMFNGNWYETCVVGMNGEWCVYVSKSFEPTSYNGDNDPANFRPIKNQREKFVEAVNKIGKATKSFDSLIVALYDAGFRAPE